MSDPAAPAPLPAHDLSPDDTRETLRLFHVQAAGLGMHWALSLPGNLVVIGFALRYIGFTKENVGLISALVSGAGLLQLVSFVVTNRFRHKRAAVVGIGSLEIFFLASILLIRPLAPGNAAGAVLLRQALFLAAVFLSAASVQMVGPLLNNWLSMVVPEAQRGRYLATRLLVTALVQTFTGFAAGEMLTLQHERYSAYTSMIVAGCMFALVAYLALARAPMPSLHREATFHLRDLRRCLGHAPYRHYLAFVVMANASFALACPYYVAFFLEEVKLTPALIARYGLAYGIVRLLAIKPAGYAVDRWGTRPVVKTMMFIYVLFFAAFPFFSRATYPLIVAIWAMVGSADAIYGVVMPSVLFRSVPVGRGRAGYFALERATTLLALAIGPGIAMAYFALAGGLHIDVAGLHIEKFRVMYFCCAGLSLLALPLARRLPDTHDVRLRGLVLGLFRLNPLAAMGRRFWRPPDLRRTNSDADDDNERKKVKR